MHHLCLCYVQSQHRQMMCAPNMIPQAMHTLCLNPKLFMIACSIMTDILRNIMHVICRYGYYDVIVFSEHSFLVKMHELSSTTHSPCMEAFLRFDITSTMDDLKRTKMTLNSCHINEIGQSAFGGTTHVTFHHGPYRRSMFN